MVEVAGVMGEIGFENIQESIVIVISDIDAHSCLFVTFGAVCDARFNRNVREGSIMIVPIQITWRGVICDIDIGKTVVVVIEENDSEAIILVFEVGNAGRRRNVRKGTVAVVLEQGIGLSRKS